MCAASVIVTGVMAYGATQRAIGAMHYMDMMERHIPAGGPIRDPSGCLNGVYATTNLKELYLREMRCVPPALDQFCDPFSIRFP